VQMPVDCQYLLVGLRRQGRVLLAVTCTCFSCRGSWSIWPAAAAASADAEGGHARSHGG
jgi:hypothetical protein